MWVLSHDRNLGEVEEQTPEIDASELQVRAAMLCMPSLSIPVTLVWTATSPCLQLQRGSVRVPSPLSWATGAGRVLLKNARAALGAWQTHQWP